MNGMATSPLDRFRSLLQRAGIDQEKPLYAVLITVFEAAQDTRAVVQEGRKPWTRDETRGLVTQLDQTLLHRWAAFNRAGIAIGVGVTLVFGVACFGGGYWFRASAETSPTVTGCRFAPQPAGGEAWNCTFWTRPPTPGQRLKAKRSAAPL